jgi:WD40 repeat protein
MRLPNEDAAWNDQRVTSSGLPPALPRVAPPPLPEQASPIARGPKRSNSMLRPFAVAILAMLGGAGLASLFFMNRSVREGNTRVRVVEQPPEEVATAVAPKAAPSPDYSSWSPETTFPWDGGDATCVAFSPDGKTLAVGGGTHRDIEDTAVSYVDEPETGLVCFWNVETKASVLRIPHARDRAISISFSPDGGSIAVATRKDVKILDRKTAAVRCLIPSGTMIAPAISWTAGLVTTTSDEFWDLRDGRPLGRRSYIVGGRSVAAFSPDGSAYCVDGYLYDVSAGRELPFTLRTPEGGEDIYTAWTFSNDGKLVASAQGVWSVTNVNPLWWRRARARDFWSQAAFSGDDRAFFVSTPRGVVEVFDSATGKSLASVDTGGAITGVAASPDRLHLATVGGGPNTPVRLWRCGTAVQ